MCLATERKDLAAKRTLARKERQRERKFITYNPEKWGMGRSKNE